MRAIILKEEDATELLNKLVLSKFEIAEFTSKEDSIKVQDMHRKFHYEVTRWLQNHGFNAGRY